MSFQRLYSCTVDVKGTRRNFVELLLQPSFCICRTANVSATNHKQGDHEQMLRDGPRSPRFSVSLASWDQPTSGRTGSERHLPTT